MDLRQEVDAEGKAYVTLDILDYGARFSFYVLVPSKTPDDVAEQLATHWVAWAGPPERVVHDLGAEYKRAFLAMLERWNVAPDVGPCEAPMAASND